MSETINLRKYRIFSIAGLVILVVSLATAAWYMTETKIHLGSLISAIIGWAIFSKYHAEIAIYQLKEITNQYVEAVKASREEKNE